MYLWSWRQVIYLLLFKTQTDLALLATYLSCDSVKEMDHSTQYLPPSVHTDYLAMLNEPGVPPHQLHLKVGSLCSIMRNLCIEKGLVKNVRVRILELQCYIIQVELLSGQSSSNNDQSFCLPQINFEFQPRQSSWTVQHWQFLLQLAYATTFNSCQGLTLDRVVLDLTSPVFAHGQLYTSLSRVRKSSDICVLFPHDNDNYETVNIVHHQLLLPSD
jgi:hypothetical protein